MLKRIVIVLVVVVALAFRAIAQSGAPLSGRLLDYETGEGVMGAVVELSSVNNPESRRYTTSEHGGYFRFNSVGAGRYKILVTFIGYKDHEAEVQTSGLPKAMGNITMQTTAVEIEAVVATAVTQRTVMLGDTLRYNADAF